MKNKPRLIFLHGCVAKLYNQDENIGYYHVLNGGWNFKYDFELNHTVEPESSILRSIEYGGPFPETDDYNILINHAIAAMSDPSVNDLLKKETVDPKRITKTYDTDDEYYLVYGFSKRNLTKISICEMGWNPYEWSPYQNPVQFRDLHNAQYYADRAPDYLENVQIEQVKIHKHIVKTVESAKIVYEPKKLKQEIPF